MFPWVVPTVTPPTGVAGGASALWVGVGGSCENSSCTQTDRTLIQLGTEQDASSSGVKYSAWYEMLPSASVTIPTLTVQPGDTISASLAMVRNTSRRQIWLLRMVDGSQTWNKLVRYKSSLLSAEWIVEAPFAGRVLPLANYGTTAFNPTLVNRTANPSLTSNDAIVMVDRAGQTSNPSAPDSNTDGFSTCWGNGTTLTPCTPPSP